MTARPELIDLGQRLSEYLGVDSPRECRLILERLQHLVAVVGEDAPEIMARLNKAPSAKPRIASVAPALAHAREATRLKAIDDAFLKLVREMRDGFAALDTRLKRVENAAKPETLKDIAQQGLRVSRNACIVCGKHWAEPKRTGRMPIRCPECRA